MEKLKVLRNENVLSVEELAARAGVHRNTIARLESGKPAYPATIRKIAQALGVDARDLVKP